MFLISNRILVHLRKDKLKVFALELVTIAGFYNIILFRILVKVRWPKVMTVGGRDLVHIITDIVLCLKIFTTQENK